MVTGAYAGGGIGGYGVGSSGQSNLSGYPKHGDSKSESGVYPSLSRLKREYIDYLGTKREEIDEQQDARRMRHASQWTSEQITQLKKRRQPIVTVNKISRKIHGVIGVLARLKQDPKAYPRTPEHEKGAELATAAVRFVADSNDWDSTDYYCGEMAAIDGIAGVEINIVSGDKGDPDVEIVPFNTDSFFYDPRSYKPDFSDCRYMGVGKWLDIEEAVELFPDHEDDLRSAQESGTELTSEPDREYQWYQTDGEVRRIRLVEHWYKRKGDWYYCIYSAHLKLVEGKSPLIDEKGNTFCKYVAWSAYVDQDGDRYGFVRDLKPMQTELNMRRSKALYTMLGRRIIAPKGSFDNIEIARREASRVDGVVEYNPGVGEPSFDDQAKLAETNAQFQFYEATRDEIESFGPNVAITTGEGLERASGRAIHLLQQAGLADLGPFLQSYRGWKIRVYRAIWQAIKHHWQGERWVRVTDDEQIEQFVKVNGWETDPQTGIPVIFNKIGDLDVDIILDEGPDTVNQMADAFDTLEVLAQRGAEIPPDVLIELAPLPFSLKQRLLKKLDPPPSPEKQRAMDLDLADKESEVHEQIAAAELKKAQAYKTYIEANNPEEAQGTIEQPEDPRLTEADILEKMAGVDAKKAQAEATRAKIGLDQQKTFADMQRGQQETRIKAAQASAQMAQQQAGANKMNMEARMRPYEMQNEQNKQGMDFELKREQIRKTPTGGSKK
jgi:hypothetical protein